MTRTSQSLTSALDAPASRPRSRHQSDPRATGSVDACLLKLMRGDAVDPYPLYAAIREASPVVQSFAGTWYVFGFDEALPILASYQMRKAVSTSSVTPTAPWSSRRALARLMDPRTARLQPFLRSLSRTLLSAGRIDLVTDYAAHIPTQAACELLSIPMGDRGDCARLAKAIHDSDVHNGPGLGGDGRGPSEELRHYLRSFRSSVAWRSTSYLADLDVPSNDFVSLGVMIMVSSETTPPVIGNALSTLLENPHHERRFRDDATCRRRAIRELLRFSSPFHALFPRTARGDMTIGAHHIRQGEEVVVVLAAADRDPRRFAHADTLDFDRTRSRTLSFSLGPSYCLAASFVRLQMRIAIESVLTGYRRVESTSHDIPWRVGFGARICASLPVTLS